MRIGAAMLLGAGLGLGASAARAQSSTQRATLIDAYLKQTREQPPLYQSEPITHVVPQFNTVTYALDARLVNVEVDDADSYEDDSLKLKGYTAAPYLALSLKRFGLGFGVEAGHRTLTYASGSDDHATEQTSTVDHRGVGVYGFVKAYDGKILSATVIAGGKVLNVRHEVGPFVYGGNPEATSPADVQHYSLNEYELGLNTGIRLLKSVQLVPWADYLYVDDRAERASLESHDDYRRAAIEEDLDVFFHAQPKLSYGLDLAVRLERFEVRLGGLFGALAGSSADDVHDKTFSLSFSLDQKG
jgi:hypothetical protein